MKRIKEKAVDDELNLFDFVSIGLACHAICLLERAGVLSIIKDNRLLRQSHIKSYKNPPLIRAALATLVGAKIFKLVNGAYQLTSFGKKITANIGALMLPFVGYRHLLAKQFELLENPRRWADSDIDYRSIAISSIEFGEQDLDPILTEIFLALKPRGTICDLGCGTGEKLVKICGTVKTSGLGIEKDPAVIRESKKYTNDSRGLEIICADITKLKGVWEDVEIAMINFVLHDIGSITQSVRFLKSIPRHFPRLRCLIVVDIVSLSEKFPSILPGFDYVHGLQGITPRNYEETLQVFEKAKFRVMNEISVPNMPNTFIWVAQPS
jgi:SAM-dependent methyltransferase